MIDCIGGDPCGRSEYYCDACKVYFEFCLQFEDEADDDMTSANPVYCPICGVK